VVYWLNVQKSPSCITETSIIERKKRMLRRQVLLLLLFSTLAATTMDNGNDERQQGNESIDQQLDTDQPQSHLGQHAGGNFIYFHFLNIQSREI